MESFKVALLKQNGKIIFKDFIYCDDISNLELLIENKGQNFEIVEEGYVSDNRYYNLLGYKSGDKFSKHDFNNYNLYNDAIMIIFNNTNNCCDIEQYDIDNYFMYDIISDYSSISFSDEYDEYDFTDEWLINDLTDECNDLI